MTILKDYSYKEYKVSIKGEFKKHYSIKFNEEWLDGGVETTLFIFDNKDNLKRHISFIQMSDRLLCEADNFVAKNRFIGQRLFRKPKGIITIQEDLDRVLNEWTEIANKIIDNIVKEKEDELYEKLITDGLPNSLNDLYR